MITRGKKIRKIRELKDFTQEYMADQLEMSQSSYSRYENDEVEVDDEILLKIANILNVKKEFIERFDENTVFSNNTNTANDQAKSNLLIGNNSVTVNQYADSEKDELYQKTIELLEEKVAMLKKQLGK